MRISLAIILVFLFCPFLMTGQFSGVVIDADTETVLRGVEVLVPDTGLYVESDAEGRFTLDIAPEKGLRLICYKEGYEILDFVVTTVRDNYTMKLGRLSVELSDIEIVRKRQEIFATKKLEDIVGTSIYAGKKTEVVLLDLVKGNIASNVSRQVYAQISGLNIYEGSDGGLQLNIGGRGLDPNRTSNFNSRQNGYDISADVLGYPENYYTPPAEALEEIRIVRGASSLQYGTQFGGLIDFRIRQIPQYREWDIRTKQTIGSFNFFNSFNSIGYNKGKVSLNGFYNYKRGDGYRANSEFVAHNGFLSGAYRASQSTNISFDVTYYNYLAKQAGGLTDSQFAATPRLSTRDRNWFEVDWQLYNMKVLHEWSGGQKVELSLFALNAQRNSVGYRGNPIALNENPILGIDEQDSNGDYINPRDLILGRFRNVGAEIKFLSSYALGDITNTLLVGSKIYKSNNTSIQGPGTTGVDADFSLQSLAFPDYASQSNFIFPNLNLALFAENIFYLSDQLSITPGLRLEYIKTETEGTFQDINFDLAGNVISNIRIEESRELPRSFVLAGIGIDYKISEQLKFSANVSQNYRSVTFSDIRVVNPSFIVDEDISDEKGLSINTGVTGRVKSRFSYDVGLYSILYNNRIGIRLDDRANRERTNIGNAIIVGTESLLNYVVYRVVKDNEKIFQAKTFLNTAYTYSRYLTSLSNNVEGNTVEFIPTLTLKTGVTINYKQLSASIQYSYTGEQFTDAQNSLASTSDDLRSGIIGQIPAYQIMDLSVGYTLKHFSIDAGINNLLDSAYYTRRATGYPGPGIIPSEGRSVYLTIGYLLEQ